MKTIDDVLSEFLNDQKERLKPRTFNDYDSVIDFFRIYLNGYGYQHLSDDLSEDYFKHNSEDDEAFTKTYRVDQISESESVYAEFFEYFIIRKVASGESFIKNAVRVMKKFTKWLKETNHISKQQYDMLIGYFDDNKGTSLANAEKATELISVLAMASPEIEYDEIIEDYFTISKIKPKKLWFTSMSDIDEDIGPITVPNQISDLLVVDSDIFLVIGKKKNEWIILESGNVYP